MNWPLLRRLLGIIALLVGVSMLFSIPWAFPACGQVTRVETNGLNGLLWGIALSWICGGLLFWSGRGSKGPIYRREALAVVGVGWILAALLGAVPYYASGTQRDAGTWMSPADAFFESMSGFTTTGASVLSDVEAHSDGTPSLVPRCILFWRSFTHFLGGMGIVVLFVALLGHLGGAKLLFRREVSGLARETIQPRIAETARILWVIYVGLNLACAVLLIIFGMSIYDALCHAFGTLATGGFSTRNLSIAAFPSPAIHLSIIVFMLAGGTNYTLYFLLWRRQWRSVFANREWWHYGTILLACTLFIAVFLLRGQGIGRRLLDTGFQVASIMTTTGYATVNFDTWPPLGKAILLVLMFVGGSVGSTGGGVKVLRWMLLVRVLWLEVHRAFRPHAVRSLRLGGQVVDPEVRHDVVVYIAIVFMVFAVSWLVMVATQPDYIWQQNPGSQPLRDSATAVIASMNNIGPGLGLVGPTQNYGTFTGFGKMFLTLLMLLGRLEYYTVLVLFARSFWKAQ